jgi:hypothetical protein
MMNVDEIKGSIAKLSDDEKVAIKRWMDDIDADIFDAKIEQDAASGKLDDLIAKARENYKAGRRTPL